MAEEPAEAGAATQPVPAGEQAPQTIPVPPLAEHSQLGMELPQQMGGADRCLQAPPADKSAPACRVPGCVEPLYQLYNMVSACKHWLPPLIAACRARTAAVPEQRSSALAVPSACHCFAITCSQFVRELAMMPGRSAFLAPARSASGRNVSLSHPFPHQSTQL